MNTQNLRGQFLSLNVAKSDGGGGGRNALFKAFSAVMDHSVDNAVHTDFFLRTQMKRKKNHSLTLKAKTTKTTRTNPPRQ